MFYKIMQILATKFHIILIDIIGMGSSCRPTNFDHKTITPTEADNYFVDFLEKWREATGVEDGFILAGHSFGGYICG